MAKRKAADEDKVEVNVIALIDITFLIIVFLLVTSEFASVDRMENLELPSAIEAKPERASKDRLIIGVDRDGNIIVAGRKKTLQELRWVLEAERESRRENIDTETEQPILIQADRNVQFGSVRDVIRVASEVNFRKLSFSTKIQEVPSARP